MRAFLALVDKEWRDARSVAIAFALLVSAAIYGTEELFAHWQRPDASGTVVCCLVVLFVAVICADLVASDRTSGRSGTFALLPTGGAQLWLAKVAFAGAATVLFTAWTALVMLLLHAGWAEAEHLGLLLQSLGDQAPSLALLTIAAGGSALLFSTLLPRALPAAILGIASSVGAVALLMQVDTIPLERPPLSVAEASVLSGALGGLLALGALIVHHRRRVHTGSAATRAALGLSLFVGVAVPSGAVYAGVVHTRTALSPGDPWTRILGMEVSPDGRFLAATVSRRNEYWYEQHQRRVWIIDVASGAVREFPGRSRQVANPAFAADGALRVTEVRHRVRRGASGGYSVTATQHAIATVSPDDGTKLAVEPYLSAVRRTSHRRGGWCDELRLIGDGSTPPLRFRVRSEPLGIDTEVESVTWIHAADRPGHVLLQPEERVVVQRDLTTGTDVFRFPVRSRAVARPLADGLVTVHEALPVGERVTWVLDATTGEPLLGPLREVRVNGAAGAWLHLLHRATSRSELVHAGTLARRATDVWARHCVGTVIPGLGTALAEGSRIIVLDDHGNVVRTYLDGE